MKRRCLIVDPSAMVRRVTSRIVREMDFEIIEAKSAQEALDSCAGAVPDAVLMEGALSDMDGASFMTALRDISAQQGNPMPTVLFCSADRGVDKIVAALKAGADEYIMKPFDSDIIASKFAIAGLIEPDLLGGAACAAS